MRFRTILMDPPWRYDSPGWKGGADKEYDTLPVEAIQKFPIHELVEDSAHLWMWTTDTHNEAAVEIAESWGFRKLGTWTWFKLCQKPLDLSKKQDRERLEKARREGEPVVEWNGHKWLMAWGNGYYGRSVWEALVLFGRGKNLVHASHKARQTRKYIVAPVREHSAKPYESIELVRRYSPKDRLECFAREVNPGFYAWGDEVNDYHHPALDEWSEWARLTYQTQKAV